MGKVATVGIMLTAADGGLEAGFVAAESRVEQFASRTDGVLAKIGSAAGLNQQASFGMLEALNDELELLKATSDEQRQKIRLAHEYRDALKAIADSSASEPDKAAAFTRVNEIHAIRSDEIGGGQPSGFRKSIDSAKELAQSMMPIIGISKLIAKETDALAQGLSQAARETMKGEKSWAETALIVGEKLPAGIGDWVKSAQSLYDAGTDMYAMNLQWRGFSETVVDQWRSSASTAEKVAEMSAKTAKAWDRMQKSNALAQSYEDELQLLNAATDADRERLRLQFELRDELKKIDEMGPNSRRFELQDKARELHYTKLGDLEAKLADEAAAEKAKADKEAADAKAKADEQALAAMKKRSETEAGYWLKQWDGVNAKMKEAQKEDAKAKADAEKLATDSAAKLVESTRTPIEQYTAKLAEIDKLLASGHLNADDAARAAQAAQQAAGLGGGKHVLAGITEAGSVAAYRNSVRAVDTGKIDREQLAEAKKQTGLLQKTLAAKGKQIELLPSSM